MESTSLSVLLIRWQEAFEQGKDLSAEELCPGQPHLAEQLRPALEQLRQLRSLSAWTEELVPATVAPTEAVPATVAPAANDETCGLPGTDESPPTQAPSAGDSRTPVCLPAPATTEVIQVPDYEILEELGRGGMGVVYNARQVKLNRLVALKMILAGGRAGAAQLPRFRTEAEAIARLQHPNIVAVYEVGEHQGMPFLALEFCAGGSLDRKLAGSPVPAEQAARLVEALARAMHVAHLANVIHRDLKPANVLLGDDGTPKITDFGLAKKLDEVGQTHTGDVMGTPSYMAPEQARGSKDIGPAADVYALGAILYELLGGRPPFKAATVYDTLVQVISEEPAPPRRLNAQVPADLETICLKCLHKEPVRRYSSAAELADDLGRYLAGEPIRARPVSATERAWKWARRRPAVAGLLLALVLLTGAALGTIAVFYHNAVWQAAEALREAERARQAEQQAEHERDHAHAMERIARQEQSKTLAEKKRAEKQLTRAEWLLYASQVQAAQREWEAGDAARAWEHLDACRWDYRGLEHRCLVSLFEQNQTSLRGHADTVWAVAISPDGSRIASGGQDSIVKVWDSRSGRARLTLAGHTRQVSCVAFSPDSSRIVSGSVDRSLKVWDASSGRLLRTLQGHAKPVNSVAISADGRRIVSGSSDNTVKVWDAGTGEELRTLRGHSNWVSGVAISPDGRRIVSSSGDRTLQVRDGRSPPASHTLRGHTGYVWCVALSPDGRRIVSGSSDHTAKVWDCSTGKLLHTLGGHADTVRGVAVSPDGRTVITASRDRTLKVWDLKTAQERFTLRGHTSWVTCVAAGPDGHGIVSGGDDRTVKVWYMNTAQGLPALKVPPTVVYTVAIDPDSHRIASAGGDGAVTVCDMKTRQVLRVLRGHTSWVNCVLFSPDGQRIVSGSNDTTVKVWEARTGKLLRILRGRGGKAGGVRRVAISRDGARIVGAGGEGAVTVWDAKTGAELFSVQAPVAVNSVAISSGGRWIVTGGKVGQLEVWDLKTRKARLAWEGHTSWVNDLAISPDDQRIVSGGGDDLVKVWNARTGRNLLTLHGHTNQVNSVAISPDGSRIVSGSWDKTVKVWEARTGQELLTLKGHATSVNAVAVSPDGRWIVSGSNDETVKLWDARSEQDLFSLRGHTSAVSKAAISGDGKELLGQDAAGKVLAWDAATGQPLPDPPARMPGGAAAGNGRLRLSADGKLIRVVDLAIRKRQHQLDRERLERLTRFDPDWHRRRLESALQAGDDFAAAFHAQRLILGQPLDAALHIYLAHVFARFGKRQKCALHLTQALLLDPHVSLWPVDPGAARRGTQAAQAGDWRRAVWELRLAAHQPKATLSSVTDLLLAEFAAGDTAGARATIVDLASRLRQEKGQGASWVIFSAQAAPWEKTAAASHLHQGTNAVVHMTAGGAVGEDGRRVAAGRGPPRPGRTAQRRHPASLRGGAVSRRAVRRGGPSAGGIGEGAGQGRLYRYLAVPGADGTAARQARPGPRPAGARRGMASPAEVRHLAGAGAVEHAAGRGAQTDPHAGGVKREAAGPGEVYLNGRASLAPSTVSMR
jgi:WD40 repeat protein